MAQKQLKGIGGVLGTIISRNEAAANVPEADETRDIPTIETPRPIEVPEVESAGSEATKSEEPLVTTLKAAVTSKKKEARRGRPLGNKAPTAPVEREKVSLRLRADLAATYRDWSWEEHCQFSDLVDKALEFYLKSRGKARKPEKE